MSRFRYPARLIAVLALLVAAASTSAAPAQAVDTTTVVVQGGTTITDSGLYDNVILPGFEAQFPQYDLQFVAVGTSQALINAENGQGDAVWTHNPPAEQTFINGGYSDEPFGRAIMYSDFITVGPTSDPAGVKSDAPHNAAQAFADIAAAGAAGHAEFISRGDGSGTNLKEKQIWALTGVTLNTLGEPGPAGSSTDASWYHKAGLGQGQTLQITDQCPFSSGKCYMLVDRGTFNYLNSNGTISNLSLLSQRNDPPAPGGQALLNNLYHAYAVKPGSTSRDVNIDGAIAFLNYLTEPSTQKAISKYPGAKQPTFFPDAYPQIVQTQKVPTTHTSASDVTVTGSVSSVVPFSLPLSGAEVDVTRAGSATPVATGTIDSNGNYSITFTPTRTDVYSISFPQFQDMRATSQKSGKMSVKANIMIALGAPGVHSVPVTGTALPATNRIAATVKLQYKKAGTTTWVTPQQFNLPNGTTNFAKTLALPSAGKFQIRAQYLDPGAVTSAYSTVRTVTVS